MDAQRIEKALALADTTKSLIIETGAISRIDTVFRNEFGDTEAVLIADTNTFEAAGDLVTKSLESGGIIVQTPYIFPGAPRLHADLETVAELESFLATLSATPIAVGSGTINDITKAACTRIERPYMIVATAASMDGYTSFGASISHAGFKKPIPCTAPRAVLADMDVLASAPEEMVTWGYGDLIGKIIAGADWILADELGIEPIDEAAWGLVMDPLRGWVSNPEGLKGKDPEVISDILEGLVVTGLAMQVAKSSRVASGSEHLIGHLWEMEGLTTDEGDFVSHGLFVGVGTVVAAALFDVFMKYDLEDLDIRGAVSSWPSFDEISKEVKNLYDQPNVVEHALEECRDKYIDHRQLEERLNLLVDRWDRIKSRLGAHLMSAKELQDQLRRAGAMTSPLEFGVGARGLRKYYRMGLRERSRYTILDTLEETGLYDRCLDELFSRGGIWANMEP